MRSQLRTGNHQDYVFTFLYWIMSRKKLRTYVTRDSVVFFSLSLISISLSRGLWALELYVRASADLFFIHAGIVFCFSYISLSTER